MSDPDTTPATATKRLSQTFLIVAGATLVLLLGTLAAWAWWDATKDTIKFEFVKTLMQFLFIVFAGAILKFLADDYQRVKSLQEKTLETARVAQGERRESLRAVLGRATESYQAVKTARRILRGSMRRNDEGQLFVSTHLYDSQFVVLNDLQLDFELLSSEVSEDGQAPIEEGGLGLIDPRRLAELFKIMERCLAKLLREYEELRPSFDRKAVERGIGDLPVLAAFLTQEGFRSFSGAFSNVREAFRAEMSKTAS